MFPYFLSSLRYSSTIPCARRIQTHLERQLHRELDEPRRSSLHDVAECARSIISVHGGGSEELGVIERIKGREAELQSLALAEGERAEQSKVEIERTWPVESTA